MYQQYFNIEDFEEIIKSVYNPIGPAAKYTVINDVGRLISIIHMSSKMFRDEMAGEIYKASLNETDEESLITSLDEVKKMIIDTYHADKQSSIPS